jgi:hypothetical protein
MTEHVAYGPKVIEIAHFLAPYVGSCDLISLLHEVVLHRWPDLSVHDLIGAMVLAEALQLTAKPEGSA